MGPDGKHLVSSRYKVIPRACVAPASRLDGPDECTRPACCSCRSSRRAAPLHIWPRDLPRVAGRAHPQSRRRPLDSRPFAASRTRRRRVVASPSLCPPLARDRLARPATRVCCVVCNKAHRRAPLGAGLAARGNYGVIKESIGISCSSSLQSGTSRQLQPAIRARHRHLKAF